MIVEKLGDRENVQRVLYTGKKRHLSETLCKNGN